MHVHTISLLGPRPKNEDDLFYNINLNTPGANSDKKRSANNQRAVSAKLFDAYRNIFWQRKDYK